jgi:hypothetical protein
MDISYRHCARRGQLGEWTDVNDRFIFTPAHGTQDRKAPIRQCASALSLCITAPRLADSHAMRVCYHIQSHRDPEQIGRLVRTIKKGSPHSLVHISHDRTGAPLDIPALEALGDVVVHLSDGGYGDFSHVDRHMDVINWLLDTDNRVDWLINITGQDYPLMPIAQIERELAESGADGFLQYYPGFGEGSKWPAHRVRSRYYFRHTRIRRLTPRWRDRLHLLQAANFVQPLVRVHVSYGLMLGRRVRTPFGKDFQVYGGSAFMSLTWPVMEYLRDYWRDNPDVVRHFRRSLSPVEAAFHTVLLNAGRFTFVNDCKRYFDFKDSQFNHPRFLGVADIPVARASGAHFARKFDAHRDPAVFDLLDETVLL